MAKEIRFHEDARSKLLAGVNCVLIAQRKLGLHSEAVERRATSSRPRASSENGTMSLSLLKFVGQASLVDEAMLPS